MTPEPVSFPVMRYGKHAFEPGRYTITALGEVRDHKTGRILKAGYRKSAAERAARPHQRYMRVQPTTWNGPKISALVHVVLWYAAYPDTPDDYEVDHRDSNPENNTLGNLIALPFHAHRQKTTTVRRARKEPLLMMEHIFD